MNKHRISGFQGAMMFGVATLVDGTQFIVTVGTAWLPIVGWGFGYMTSLTVGLIAWCLFAFWFSSSRVSFVLSWRSLVILPELFPVINVMPLWTGAIAFNILISRWEDRRQEKKDGIEEGPAERRMRRRAPVAGAAKTRFVDAVQPTRNNRVVQAPAEVAV